MVAFGHDGLFYPHKKVLDQKRISWFQLQDYGLLQTFSNKLQFNSDTQSLIQSFYIEFLNLGTLQTKLCTQILYTRIVVLRYFSSSHNAKRHIPYLPHQYLCLSVSLLGRFCHRKFAAKTPNFSPASMIFSPPQMDKQVHHNRNIPSSHQTRNYYQLSPLSKEVAISAKKSIQNKVWARKNMKDTIKYRGASMAASSTIFTTLVFWVDWGATKNCHDNLKLWTQYWISHQSKQSLKCLCFIQVGTLFAERGF